MQDTREELVEVALQVLITTLDQDAAAPLIPGGRVARFSDSSDTDGGGGGGLADNLFLNYLSRIHREEDFDFVLKGVTRQARAFQ